MNRVTLFGNVGKDPEVRSLDGGAKVANFSLATTERWKDRDGAKQERTEWHRCVLWGPQAEVAEQWVKKGSKLLIEGKLQTRKWVDQGGQERYTTEIHVQHFEFGGSADRNESADQGEPPRQRARAAAPAGRSGGSKIVDDDIPF